MALGQGRQCAKLGCRRRRRRDAKMVDGEAWYCWQHLGCVGEEGAPPRSAAAAKAPAAGAGGGGGEGDSEDLPTCSECHGTHDAQRLMLCEHLGCARRTHTYCAEPKMPFVPTGCWYCKEHAQHGAPQLLPAPGEKVMVNMSKEMHWWPAVVVPQDAPYLPAQIPRKGGGIVDGGHGGTHCRAFKSKMKTKRGQKTHHNDPETSKKLIVAYYGHMAKKNGAFAMVNLMHDKVRKLDFKARSFREATGGLKVALEMARAFDIDLKKTHEFVLVQREQVRGGAGADAVDAPAEREAEGNPSSTDQPDDIRTALVFHLARLKQTLTQFCEARGLKYRALRNWLSDYEPRACLRHYTPADTDTAVRAVYAALKRTPGAAADGGTHAAGTAATTTAAVAPVEPKPTTTTTAVVVKNAAAGEGGGGATAGKAHVGKRKLAEEMEGDAAMTMADPGRVKAPEGVPKDAAGTDVGGDADGVPGDGGSGGASSTHVSSGAAGSAKRRRVDASRTGTWSPPADCTNPLVVLWSRATAQHPTCLHDAALNAPFAVTPHDLQLWKHGFADTHAVTYIERAVAHVLTWHLDAGEIVIKAVQRNGVKAVPERLALAG